MRFLIYCDVLVPWLTDWTLTLGPTLKLKLKLYEISLIGSDRYSEIN